jgi:hypothetical protein
VSLISLAVQQVELIDHKSWFAAHEGSLVLAGAALAALLGTIIDRRRALANDRHIKRLEHVRDRIDEALRAMADGHQAVSEFFSNIKPFEDRRATERSKASPPVNLQELEDEIKKWLTSKRDAAAPKVNALAPQASSLFVRLGPEDELYKRFEKCQELNFQLYGRLLPGVDENRSPEDQTGDAAVNKERHEAFHNWEDACRKWFKTELPETRGRRRK